MEMSNEDIAKGLRTTVDRCQKHIRALNYIELELDKFSEGMLINIISRKLGKQSEKG